MRDPKIEGVRQRERKTDDACTRARVQDGNTIRRLLKIIGLFLKNIVPFIGLFCKRDLCARYREGKHEREREREREGERMCA